MDTYKKFKGMDGEAIVNSRVKTVLKSKVSEVTTDYSMMDIYSGNRSEINNKITEYLNNAFEKEYGIQVLDASIIDVHPDDKLKESIDNRVTALQQKQQAQVEQETAKVQNFGMVENAYVRVVDADTGEELMRFDLSEDFSTETAIVVAEIYRHNGEWKFKAVGSGYNGGLAALCRQYGIDAE